jgi:hypothetical protein
MARAIRHNKENAVSAAKVVRGHGYKNVTIKKLKPIGGKDGLQRYAVYYYK